MDVRWLRTFVDLAEYGTLREVAQISGYSTSAISHQLASLQRELGTVLASPSGRVLKLTPEGQSFLPRAREVLAILDAAQTDLKGADLSATIVVAGYGISLVRHIIPATKALRTRLPDLVVKVEEREPDEVQELLARDLIDIGVVYDYSLAPAGYSGAQFDRMPMMLAVPESLPGTAEEILASPLSEWIVNPRMAGDEELLRRVLATYDAVPRIHHRIDSIELATACIATGSGVAVLPADSPRNPRVRYLSLDGSAGERRSFFLSRPGREAWPSYLAVMEAITEAAASNGGC